jgi:hypothetical protein
MRLQRSRNASGTDILREAVTTSTGPLWFARRVLYFTSHAVVFARMQQLHRQIIFGQVSELPEYRELRPWEAQIHYYCLLMSTLGQLAVSSKELRQDYFLRLLNLVNDGGSMDGLESVFLTGLATVSYEDGDASFLEGAKTWERLSSGLTIGGGMPYCLLFDTESASLLLIGQRGLSELGGASNIASLSGAGGLAVILNRSGLCEDNGGWFRNGAIGVCKYGATAAGAALGAEAGPLGAGAGGAGGAFAGNAWCGDLVNGVLDGIENFLNGLAQGLQVGPLPTPATPGPSTPETSTPQPSTPEPSTPEPSTPEPSTPGPSTPEPSTPEPSTPEPGPQPTQSGESESESTPLGIAPRPVGETEASPGAVVFIPGHGPVGETESSSSGTIVRPGPIGDPSPTRDSGALLRMPAGRSPSTDAEELLSSGVLTTPGFNALEIEPGDDPASSVGPLKDALDVVSNTCPAGPGVESLLFKTGNAWSINGLPTLGAAARSASIGFLKFAPGLSPASDTLVSATNRGSANLDEVG